jgi:hypothetical protein
LGGDNPIKLFTIRNLTYTGVSKSGITEGDGELISGPALQHRFENRDHAILELVDTLE